MSENQVRPAVMQSLIFQGNFAGSVAFSQSWPTK